ncbi:MAG: septum formation initiator family protein, partial [Firmicutes bacterium]|nr:septum formation initiator family protein [Bacillota bacterium]
IGRSGLILTLIIIIAASYFAVSALKIVRLNAEKEEALARQEELLMIKEDLTAEYNNINSAQYIERLARRDLKLVKSNELLFILPERELGNGVKTEEAEPEGE